VTVSVEITAHAIERYRERVADVSVDEARQALLSPAVLQAAEFGAPYVRLGTGQRIVIANGAVVTVLPKDKYLGCFDPRRRGLSTNRRMAK